MGWFGRKKEPDVSGVVPEVRRRLGIDPRTCRDTEDGFTWQSQLGPQRVVLEKVSSPTGEACRRVRASLIMPFDFDELEQYRCANAVMNEHVTVNALTPGTVFTLDAWWPLREGFVESAVEAITVAAAMQVLEAAWMLDDRKLAEEVGATVRVFPSPPEILAEPKRSAVARSRQVLERTVPRGPPLDPRVFHDARTAVARDATEASASDDGVTVEFATGRDWPGSKEFFGTAIPCTVMLQVMRGQSHPLLGEGLSLRLNLPYELGPRGNAVFAAAANHVAAEGSATSYGLGGWFADRLAIHHLAFVPIAFLGERPAPMLVRLIRDEHERARWAAHVLEGIRQSI